LSLEVFDPPNEFVDVLVQPWVDVQAIVIAGSRRTPGKPGKRLLAGCARESDGDSGPAHEGHLPFSAHLAILPHSLEETLAVLSDPAALAKILESTRVMTQPSSMSSKATVHATVSGSCMHAAKEA